MSTDNDVALALGVVALVPAVFASACPSLADVRGSDDVRGDVAHGITAATTTAAAAVLAITLATRSAAVLVYGGAMVAGYAAMYARARVAAP